MKQLNIILLGIIISLLVCQQFMRNPYRKGYQAVARNFGRGDVNQAIAIRSHFRGMALIRSIQNVMM
jgi:replicative DNA helicase